MNTIKLKEGDIFHSENYEWKVINDEIEDHPSTAICTISFGNFWNVNEKRLITFNYVNSHFSIGEHPKREQKKLIPHYELWNHMLSKHNLNLSENELEEIVTIIKH